MKQHQERGQKWLETLLKLMGFPASVTATVSNHEDSVWLTIDPSQLTQDQIEDLIGEHGKTIDAIQYLGNTLLNIGVEYEEQQPFTVELNDYRVERQAQLQAEIEEAAERVRTTGQEVEMKLLSSAERRQVHNFFKESDDLATESRGAEPHRRLFVRLR